MSEALPDAVNEQVRQPICAEAEHVEMPGLRLSRNQA